MTASTHKKKIDSAVFAAAGGLLLWAGWQTRAARAANPNPSLAVPLASIGGYGLALYGAYRVSPKAAAMIGVGLLGVGAINKSRREAGKRELPLPGVELRFNKDNATADDGLDQGLSKDTRAAVRAALSVETNPAILASFAQYLADAGHSISAHLVDARARLLAAGHALSTDPKEHT